MTDAVRTPRVAQPGRAGPVAPGSVVAGRYEVVVRIGSGGTSSVYEALDRVTGASVALEMLEPGISGAALRAHREISALRPLRLPGVVGLLDEGIDGDTRFLVMDRVHGRAFPATATPTTLEVLAPHLLALLEILGRVHAAGVVHRDLEPSNVLVDDEGRVTVLDFGISWGPALGEAVTTAGAIVGTPEYLAPEQFVGAAADARTDLYAVGVMLYEALSGEPPHRASEFSELVALKRSQMPVPLRIAAPTVLGPFEDVELELWRQGQRMMAAHWLPVEREAVILGEIAAWARRSGNPRAEASAAAWRALHLIALGRRREAAPLHLEAAKRTQRVVAKMAGLLNAAFDFHGCGLLRESEDAARAIDVVWSPELRRGSRRRASRFRPAP